MTASTPRDRLWQAIERERARDTLVRRICVGAWTATGIIILLFALMTSATVVEMARGAMRGDVPWATVVSVAMPFLGALWTLSLLVATLSTVAMFFRQRAASLTDIQARLASLEEVLRSRPE
jgi:hypothetical protein